MTLCPVSSITVNRLRGLRNKGLFSASCVGHVPDKHRSPSLLPDEVVSHVAFHERPAHDFFHGLLFYYDIELHHLTPSGVLHAVAFITLCEAFLVIHPHFRLWKYFFHVRAEPRPLPLIGGVIF
jgi:hypothetical protein